ncbi:alpha/beta hydrolase [Sphingobacterium anhuiense]|uniref:Alpha/beta hydrolase n=1 Tax=Sphingobacterium anhuiense TaxID=493780 RepID=A0ABW5YW51_9SPHI
MLRNIDPELLEAIAASPYSKIKYEYLLQNDPTKIRAEELRLSLNEEPLIIPEQLLVENRLIPSSQSEEKIRLRIYKPKAKQDLPILLYFHGGAFIYGTPEQYDFILFRLALEVGMLIVSVDYRLAPEHPFPAAIEDGYDTLLWLYQNAGKLDGNQNMIIIGGSSSGATIAASITHLARDKKNAIIQHQYLLYPPMSDTLKSPSMDSLAKAPMQTKIAAAWMWKHYLRNTRLPLPKYAVPLGETNFHHLPDATIIVCEFDPLKDEGKLYTKKLRFAGVCVKLLEIEGAVHAFDFFPCELSETFYAKQIELFKKIINQKK